MIILGITGPTGAGKTTVSKMLEGYSIAVIDTDILAREIVEPGKRALYELTEYFGEEILLPDGELDRRKLAGIAFSDSEALESLNKITHKYILEEIEKIAENYNGDILGIDGAVLIESGISKRCTKVLSVIADAKTRKERIMERDLVSSEDADLRMSAQKNNEFYIENSDYVVYNNDTETLSVKLQEIITELRSMI